MGSILLTVKVIAKDIEGFNCVILYFSLCCVTKDIIVPILFLYNIIVLHEVCSVRKYPWSTGV